MATQHDNWQVRMEEVDATFCEVFSDTRSAESVRLLPWCISTLANPDVIPVHHLSEVLATTVQPGVDAPVAAPLLQSLRAHRPWPLHTVLHATLRLYLFPSCPCWMFSLLGCTSSLET